MTSNEYNTRRESLVAKLASAKSVTVGNRSVTNRDIKEIQLAITALDAEWQRSQGTSIARIGRMYFSGEGR